MPLPEFSTPDEPTDEELFDAYRNSRERSAFEELVRRYRRELTSYLRRHLGDDAAAEDVLQLTWLQVHEKQHLYDRERPFRPWLYGLARHLAIDRLRSSGRHPTFSVDIAGGASDEADEPHPLAEFLPGHEQSPAALAERDERREWVHQAVAELPEHLREVVQLVYLDGCKFAEAASRLGIAEGTLKSRVHAALVRLQRAWEQTHPASAET